MTEENLRKSISLIGPSGVGKSLLASELSSRLGMPNICIDDLMQLVDLEMRGVINTNKFDQEQYKKDVIKDIARDPMLKDCLNDEYKDKEIALVNEFVDMYNNYHNLIKDFTPLYDVVNAYMDQPYQSFSEQEVIITLNDVAIKMIEYVYSVVDQPIVLDPPGSFGWDMVGEKTNMFTKMRLKKYGISIPKLQDKTDEILSKTNTVLLCPGLDYDDRNLARGNDVNEYLLHNIDHFYKNADLVISTNGLFNTPSNRYLQQRTWFNAKEWDTKQKLKNNGTISNMCDEIVLRIDELSQSEDENENI
ncbi:MAG: hypothetical protein E7361_01200 [Clostridiales bacterium]|nr:hypothetical protein [Clostridiales bacterium]